MTGIRTAVLASTGRWGVGEMGLLKDFAMGQDTEAEASLPGSESGAYHLLTCDFGPHT